MEIPEPFVWDESFRVFYDNLDEEHREVFDAVMESACAPCDRAKFQRIYDLSVEHFATEEEMFCAANFDGAGYHKKVHQEFLDRLKTICLPLTQEDICFIKHWVVNHIKAVDFKYRGKLCPYS